jgi:hypothetical protein
VGDARHESLGIGLERDVVGVSEASDSDAVLREPYIGEPLAFRAEDHELRSRT